MVGLRLNETAARDVLLIRAIESEDTAAALLTRDDRQYSSHAALNSSRLSEDANRRQTAAFLSRRARVALERLVGRYPSLERVGNLTRWPRLLNWGLPLGALLVGLATNAIDGNQLNILAFPLLGMLAWNLAIYVWLLVGWVRQRLGGRKSTEVPTIIQWLLRPASAHLAGHPTLERAVIRFGRDWSNAAAPLTRSRLNRTLHLSAATFALGIVAGMFARARYTAEYTAGWAGTWAGAETEIAALLKVVLGPASALTGIALPTVERLRELRGAGENAGDWLILWMVTAGLFVIAPRLLLGLGSFLRSLQLRRRLAVPHDFYVRRVLRDAIGRARVVRVVPYSFELSAASSDTLKQLLVDALGEKTSVEMVPSIAYGDEDAWLASPAGDLGTADQIIILFNLASTPEAENHGAFVEAIRQRVGREAELTVLIDDTSFTHKLRGQASAERRVEERLYAWSAVLAPTAVELIPVSLKSPPDAEAARRLEQALLESAPAR